MVPVPRRPNWSTYERFYDSHFVRTRAVLALALGDVELAEDATQEAFVRAFARWRSVDTLDKPERWIYVVALNVARDTLRRRERHRFATVLLDTQTLDERVDDRLDIVRALKSLPPRQRQVVVLRYLADLSTAETAKAMGCAEGTVRASLHTAVQSIAEIIGEREP
jgi:RNA polymerase sigma factor (sigma-70 family)